MIKQCLDFQAFFNYPGVAELLPSFCVFHVNAPGMEEGAEKLPEEFVYPSMDELAEQVRRHFAKHLCFNFFSVVIKGYANLV